MPSKWTKRLYIIVPIGIANAARRSSMGAVFSAWTGEAMEDEALMFTARLSANGEEPATHLGASTLVTDDLYADVDAEMKRNLLPAASWELVDAKTGLSLAGNLVDGVGFIAFHHLLTWDGLQRIVDREV